MKILALDTAGNGCSACVWEAGTVLASAQEPMAHGQAERLIPMLAELQQRCGLDWSSLDRIAVTVGPGSFTGLRVGLAAAQGLTLATGVPVIGVTTLETYAAQAVGEGCCGPLLVAVDARRDDYYLQAFTVADGAVTAVAAPLAAGLADVADLLAGWGLAQVTVVGDAAALFAEITGVAHTHPQSLLSVATLATLAAPRSPETALPIPLYIRPPDAAIPQNGGQVRPD